MHPLSIPFLFTAFLIVQLPPAKAEMPDAIAAPGEQLVATVHAEGTQLYECKADAAGKLVWQFREPIATLLADAKTVGRHYAGPNWDFADGSGVSGKVIGRAPGGTAKDIPLLKLEVTAQRGAGQLTGVTTIQRLNTKGGAAEGSCEAAGAFLNVPYAADYNFLKKGNWARIARDSTLDADPQAALDADLHANIAQVNPATDGSMRVPSEYAEIVLVKA